MQFSHPLRPSSKVLLSVSLTLAISVAQGALLQLPCLQLWDKCGVFSSKLLQFAMVIIPEQEYSSEDSCTLKRTSLLLSERQGIPAIISVFSLYFPFLSKPLQHDNSHQPGTAQTRSSIITQLCMETGESMDTGESSGAVTQGSSTKNQT